ncbi:radical SAM superfamily protein [Anaerotignum neopropionicum]|uniref:Radical SAM superfamily protein n=1 Tax=Anaerotignum neopropionicum TaxID=36847 RepID=A0A136WFC3_9FIRM|nr:radical SAM protein [Anaerotignum neopropionicum]KXL53248.1 radical SAM superfamily protein [Anaerotignum neopropionicum]
MEQGVFQIGPIRPPSEANSLLLRVTENCPWNKCKFCMLYKNSAFHTRPVAEVKKDIDVMAEYRDRILTHIEECGEYNMEAIQQDYLSLPSDEAKICYQMVFTWLTEGNKQAIFLQDANTMVLRPDWLIEIVCYVRERLPEIQRITSYGRANTMARISAEDFKRLRAAGLDRIHSGYESGSDKVLEMIGKGATQEDEIIGGKKVKEAGIELSIYFMPGVGGRALSDENAIETAKVINEVNPDFVRLRTFVLRTGSLMEELQASGVYRELRDMEKLLEIRKMLAHIDTKKAHGKITSDHIINLLQEVTGYMDKDLSWMLEYIDSFLALPELEQKKYQLARRMGFPLDWKYLYRMQPSDQSRVEEMAKNIVDEKEWEALLHRFTDRYI